MIDQKQLENVECFKYLGSLLTKILIEAHKIENYSLTQPN